MIQQLSLTPWTTPEYSPARRDEGAEWNQHLERETVARSQNAARYLLPAVFFQPWSASTRQPTQGERALKACQGKEHSSKNS